MRKKTEELWKEAGGNSLTDYGVEWLETFRRLVIENERECTEAVGYFYVNDRGFWNQAGDPISFPSCTTLFTFPPAAQVSEWQPIETAPKELGKRILGLKDCGEGTLTSISIVFWLNDGEWHINDCAPRTAEGFGYRVTHWMPLPSAPEESK